MGLNIVVGVTAGAWEEYAGVREHFAVIGRLLDRAGAGQWAERNWTSKTSWKATCGDTEARRAR